jgi:hypothetical protein
MPRPPLLKFLPCLVALTCLAAFTACENTIPSGANYVVSAQKAGFYKYGPAQTFGPDFMLDQDTEVTILQHAMGFSRVATANGISGYVSNDDIKPAPPKPPTQQEAALARNKLKPVFGTGSGYGSKPRPSDVQPVPGSPLFESGELAPLPDKSENKPKPRFRF